MPTTKACGLVHLHRPAAMYSLLRTKGEVRDETNIDANQNSECKVHGGVLRHVVHGQADECEHVHTHNRHSDGRHKHSDVVRVNPLVALYRSGNSTQKQR